MPYCSWWRPTSPIPRNIQYYLARTSYGSTRSADVHAWVLARNHREQALEYFIQALDADIADVQGGTTSEGFHLAAMAGTVDILQRCFAGARVSAAASMRHPIRLHCRGETALLSPGETVEFSYPGPDG